MLLNLLNIGNVINAQSALVLNKIKLFKYLENVTEL